MNDCNCGQQLNQTLIAISRYSVNLELWQQGMVRIGWDQKQKGRYWVRQAV